jgi:glutamyl-tRNA synthetase
VAVRGRFAPSPTGELHLGNARTALLAWLQVRATGGTLVMRVEDLDTGRVRPGIMEAQLADLRWLGLDWDEGPDVGGPFWPYVQSERTERYAAALSTLEGMGLLFPCVCTRRDIAAASSAPHAEDEEGPRYPGTCRDAPPAAVAGRAAALRFRAAPDPVPFHDRVHGAVAFGADDFVVRRKDGAFAYQLAVVVDDAAMGITDVLRGADLLPSTARQVLLFRALGLPAPRWTHVPLLLGPDGERLAKRHGSVTLRDAREAGVAPDAVVGWLAATSGLAAPGERCRPRDLVPRFDPDRLPREPTVLRAPPLAEMRPAAGAPHG